MNFLLKDIELVIDDFYVEKAEALLEGSRLGNLVEVDNNLWIGLVRDGKSFEIEIQLQNKRIKAYTCECEMYQNDKICHHITAGLILLRKRNPYVPTPPKTAPVKKTPKKLTVADILSQTPDDELKSFVRQYARHNRKFALDLKTRFVGYVTSMDNQRKYDQLLETALNGVFRSYNEISKLGMDHLLKIYEELYVQIEEHIAMKNYREAMDIMTSLFKGLPSLLRRKGRHREVLFPMIQDLCKTSKELFASKMAPDLQSRLWDMLFDQAQITIYCHLGFEQPIFSVVAKKCNNEKRFSAFKTIVEGLIDFFSNHVDVRANLVEYLFTVYIENKQDLDAFFTTYLTDSFVLKRVIENFMKVNNYKDAKRLAKMGLKSKMSDILPFLENSLLEIAMINQHKKDIQKYATLRFLDTYNPDFYKILTSNTDEINNLTQQLILKLQKDKRGFSTYKTIGFLWIQIENYDAVLMLLENHLDLKLIQEFDQFLVKTKSKSLMNIYLKWIDGYLKEHFGPAPTKKIQSIVHHLYAIKADRFARRLVSKVLDAYPERQFLTKTLMIF